MKHAVNRSHLRPGYKPSKTALTGVHDEASVEEIDEVRAQLRPSLDFRLAVLGNEKDRLKTRRGVKIFIKDVIRYSISIAFRVKLQELR